MVTFDRGMLERFRAAIAEAEKHGLPVFEFEGNDYVTSYAEYMVLYMEKRFAARTKEIDEAFNKYKGTKNERAHPH